MRRRHLLALPGLKAARLGARSRSSEYRSPNGQRPTGHRESRNAGDNGDSNRWHECLPLVKHFNHPEGNVTGVKIVTGDLTPERLQILIELVPARAIDVLMNPNYGSYHRDRGQIEEVGPATRCETQHRNRICRCRSRIRCGEPRRSACWQPAARGCSMVAASL